MLSVRSVYRSVAVSELIYDMLPPNYYLFLAIYISFASKCSLLSSKKEGGSILKSLKLTGDTSPTDADFLFLGSITFDELLLTTLLLYGDF